MRKQLRAAAVMVGVMASGGAWAGEEDVGEADPSELPSPIAARLHSAYPAATVAAVERVHGGWEASLVEGMRRQDLVLDSVGNVVERHTPVAVRDLPDGVRTTLERTHPRHTVWRATEIATDGATFHEVYLARGDRRSVVLLDEDGRMIAGARRA